jgi:nitrite reductase/ring-hydroxylating ferredoxin subunit
VLALDELQEGRPQRIMVENSPVLLYRGHDRVMAIGAICAHAGGPLEEGEIYENGHTAQVQCPWHDSVFSLEDGSVVHGPSTYAVPGYDTRVRDGRIELRLSPQKLLADQGREAGRLIPGSENGGTSSSSPSA